MLLEKGFPRCSQKNLGMKTRISNGVVQTDTDREIFFVCETSCVSLWLKQAGDLAKRGGRYFYIKLCLNAIPDIWTYIAISNNPFLFAVTEHSRMPGSKLHGTVWMGQGCEND